MSSPFEHDGYYPVYDNMVDAKANSVDGTVFIVRDTAKSRDLYVALENNIQGDIKLNLKSTHTESECKDMTETKINSYNETVINENSVGNMTNTTNSTTYTVYHHTAP